MSDRKGKIQTVRGLIEPDELGTTLTHEHLMTKADCFIIKAAPHEEEKAVMPFAMENLGWIHHNPYTHKLNVGFIDEDETIVQEMEEYKALGGQSVVENSCTGLQRNVTFLKDLSKMTGLHIVSGSGFYVDGFQTEAVRQLPEEAMADQIRKDICTGADGTDICCGVIGEVGTTWPVTDFEKRSLRSAAAVHEELGSPVIIHPGRHPQAPFDVMRIYMEAGGKADRTVMSHLDRTIFDDEQLLEFAKLGCYCEFDMFGIEISYYQLNSEADVPSDAQRIQKLKCLLDNGYQQKLLIAHDMHTKHRLKKYGGHGYSHILENVVPKMKQRGFSDEDLRVILKENPATWLTFTK